MLNFRCTMVLLRPHIQEPDIPPLFQTISKAESPLGFLETKYPPEPIPIRVIIGTRDRVAEFVNIVVFCSKTTGRPSARTQGCVWHQCVRQSPHAQRLSSRLDGCPTSRGAACRLAQRGGPMTRRCPVGQGTTIPSSLLQQSAAESSPLPRK